jgi:hypothetical protein
VSQEEVETIHSGFGSGGVADEPERFDAQAPGFDRRAGLPADAAISVARAVLDIAAAGPEELLVELGAGTGEIGQHLIGPMCYVGIDRSARMLKLFRQKLAGADEVRIQSPRISRPRM